MKIKLRKIGNSKGFTIPKSILDQFNFTEEAEVVVQENGLLIKPSNVLPREKWAEVLKIEFLKDGKKDKQILGEFSNEFDEKEWTW